MSARPQHYGWPVSPYSAKTRSFLTYKGIEFDDRVPSARQLVMTIQRAVGRAVMPTVLMPDGTWLQDTSDIIDHFEARHPEPRIIPATPTQRLAAYLLELLGDEWLPMIALHYRWNVPENDTFARGEFARYSSKLPGPHRTLIAKNFADRMSGYLPKLGVDEATIPGVEAMARQLISALDTHLAAHPYVLGTRACIGDFALFGPLWAHLYRDPGSTALFDEAPHLRAWMDRLLEAPADIGTFLPDDEVPATLDPVFGIVFQELWPYVQEVLTAIDGYCEANPDATRVPRALGDTGFTIGGHEGSRRLLTFTAWMAQRPLEAYQTDPTCDAWLARVGGTALATTRPKRRQVRRDFKMALAPAS